MKRISALILIAAFALTTAQAGEVKVEVRLAKNKETKPATSFEADVPQIFAFFRTTGTKKGDSLRGVWIAEDVIGASAKEIKIDETTLEADKDNFFGSYSLSKPTNGWPVGKYRVEIYSGSDLAVTAKFEIAGAKSEAADDKDKATDTDKDGDEEGKDSDDKD